VAVGYHASAQAVGHFPIIAVIAVVVAQAGVAVGGIVFQTGGTLRASPLAGITFLHAVVMVVLRQQRAVNPRVLRRFSMFIGAHAVGGIGVVPLLADVIGR